MTRIGVRRETSDLDDEAARSVAANTVAVGRSAAGGAVDLKVDPKAPGRSLGVGLAAAAGAEVPKVGRKSSDRSLGVDLALAGDRAGRKVQVRSRVVDPVEAIGGVGRRAVPRVRERSSASVGTVTAAVAAEAGLAAAPEYSAATSVPPSCWCFPTSRCTATTSCRR